MIYIERESVDEHGRPIRPSGDWFRDSHGLLGLLEQLAPQVGRRVDLQHGEGHRPLDLGGETPHPLHFAHCGMWATCPL